MGLRVRNLIRGNKTLLNGSLFSLFSFVNQGISFILLVLLANYIAPAEYGKLSLFNTIVQFLGYFIALSSQGYLSVSFFKRGKEHFREDFSSICIIGLAVTLLFCGIIIVAGNWISGIASLPRVFLWYAIIITFFQMFQGMWLDMFRIKEKVGVYGIISCGTALLNLALSLYLVISLDLNWEGRVYAHLLCALSLGILSIVFFLKEKLFTKDVTFANIKMVAMWGIPLIPHLTSVWIKQGGDRLIINHFHTVEDVGLFSFALNLTSVIIMIGSAFNSSNSVSIFKILSEEKTAEQKKHLLMHQTKSIAVILVVTYLCVVLGGIWLVPLLLPRYSGSIPYFLILSLQGLCQCFYFLFCNYLFYYSQNNRIMYVTFFTSLLHLMLSLFLTRYSLFITCILYVFTQLLVTVLVYRMSMGLLKEKLN